MKMINRIYTAYVSWETGGKRRPILVVEFQDKWLYFYKITSKFQNKSKYIKAQYYTIRDWQKAGLVKQSYIDTGTLLRLRINDVELSYVGRLTIFDEKALARFISDRLS